jgi:putative transposase
MHCRVTVRSWLERSNSGTLYIAPGSHWQNGFAESFHPLFRTSRSQYL